MATFFFSFFFCFIFFFLKSSKGKLKTLNIRGKKNQLIKEKNKQTNTNTYI